MHLIFFAELAYGHKKRMALLDILLSTLIDGQPLSDKDIREEVDTFMFEGHDTTKSGIGFTLYSLSRHPEVQEKVYQELNEIIGTDIEGPLTYNKLMDLKYMEKVIKESLRMYPPVPFIGRQIMQDLYIGKYISVEDFSLEMRVSQIHSPLNITITPDIPHVVLLFKHLQWLGQRVISNALIPNILDRIMRAHTIMFPQTHLCQYIKYVKALGHNDLHAFQYI